MTIFVKNKHTLKIDEFKFRCSIGKKGSTSNKIEGDKKTPKGTFEIEKLYFRDDRIKKPLTLLKCVKIKKDMGWCNDIRFPKTYNKLFKIEKGIKHEKLKRNDYKYDLFFSGVTRPEQTENLRERILSDMSKLSKYNLSVNIRSHRTNYSGTIFSPEDYAKRLGQYF